MTTLAELKSQASKKGLATSGTKSQIQIRLDMTQDWQHLGDKMYFIDNTGNNPPSRTRIAGYDLDGTLIQPLNGEFCEEVDDWTFRLGMKQEVEDKQADGMLVLIFTNQARKALRHITLARLESVVLALGKCGIFVATTRDQYRKPSTGMWHLAVATYNLTPNLQESFFCGDASGLPGSHSDADAGFARTIGLPYRLPIGYSTDAEQTLSVNEQELVLLVGAPGSGKSTLALQMFPSYTVASKDLSKNKDLQVVHTALVQAQSVIIDNTNPSIESRKPYLELAKELGVKTRIVSLSTPIEVCKARNSQREKPVPSIVYNVYKSKYEEPTEVEVPVLRI